MNLESLRAYCLKLTGAYEDFPFDEETLVFKVGGKIFCITDFNQPERLTLKTTPAKSLELRAEYEEIVPGYHMNKKHWITVDTESDRLNGKFVKALIKESYELVVNGLTAAQKKLLDYSSPK